MWPRSKVSRSSEQGLARALDQEFETAGSAKKPSATARTKKRKSAEEEPASGDEDLIDADQGEGLAELTRMDPEMADVARRHAQLTNKHTTCFANLQIHRILEGQKLGKAVQGVLWKI